MAGARGACGLASLARLSLRCRAQSDWDVALRKRLRELAEQRRRFGYRRLHVLLKPEGGQ